ncbi:zinc ribbon domain-containing protein [Lysinibacillus sp. 54212]|uniref:zinc ribbon domain-containing protein n=1 Tax=Lysinibacillus sp. 54212 TaxID=3119829 RepID=UPI002FCA6A13
MPLTIDLNNIEVKEIRQLLVNAKEERVLLIFRLGEQSHQLMMRGNTDLEELRQISSEILEKDKEIFNLAQHIAKVSASSTNCSNCQQQLVPNAKFCGSCGTLNPLFEETNVEKVVCATCEETILSSDVYCPCCGSQQGAY